ncbi:uncharacterized protein LOC108106490 [Drosophila eugracilis]|uniref:uncharacterized protein LOC108106490 n=1 Tax=Drosophila eugracilis TaxID=29029 RepID=UPI0007E772F1|nr:uncharacterized protein LOC108106490 [Drosophila eugracilis]
MGYQQCAPLAPNSGADRQRKQSESRGSNNTTQHGDVIMSGPFSRSTVQQMLATSLSPLPSPSPFGGSNFVIITARAHAPNCPRFDAMLLLSARANRFDHSLELLLGVAFAGVGDELDDKERE